MSALIPLLLWWSIWFLFLRRGSLAYKSMVIIVLSLAFIYTGIIALADYQRAWYPQYTVERHEQLRLGPDSTYAVCGKIEIGDQVIVIRRISNWSCILSPSNKGWVLSDCLRA